MVLCPWRSSISRFTWPRLIWDCGKARFSAPLQFAEASSDAFPRLPVVSDDMSWRFPVSSAGDPTDACRKTGETRAGLRTRLRQHVVHGFYTHAKTCSQADERSLRLNGQTIGNDPAPAVIAAASSAMAWRPLAHNGAHQMLAKGIGLRPRNAANSLHPVALLARL
jgi:hypothetical protein